MDDHLVVDGVLVPVGSPERVVGPYGWWTSATTLTA